MHKTLATKYRISVREVIRKYGFTDMSLPANMVGKKQRATDLRICVKQVIDDQTKWFVLLNYKEFMFRLEEQRNTGAIRSGRTLYTPVVDFMTMSKINIRTKAKNTLCCIVCGSTSDLQNHHIKPLRKTNSKKSGYNYFDQVVASLGRKQITVCKYCHRSIHAGQYDGISVNELHDCRAAVTEPYVEANTLQNYSDESTFKDPKSKKSTVKRSSEFHVEHEDRTYINHRFKIYLTNKYGKENSI